jgi:anthranilate phosphoribosyltransferase
MANDFLRECLSRLIRRENLSFEAASRLLEALLDSETTDAEIAAVLVGLATKGETVSELAGMASALRARAVPVTTSHEVFIDTAGTGSSSAKTFNVSTAAAFVIAGAGLPVAKHGNRAASSRCGSADVLAALGVNVSAAPEVSQTCLDQIGLCFMFAPLYHSATARVAGIRRQLGIQTSFNLLGPLSNPARAPRQVIGVWHRDLVELLANTLSELGTSRAWVVHGDDGLDEVTTTGQTFISEAHDGGLRSFAVSPEDFGLSFSSLHHLRGGDAEANAAIIHGVLEGVRRDAARDLVVINAAAALFVGGCSDDFLGASALAQQSIDSGAAHNKLQQLVKATNS